MKFFPLALFFALLTGGCNSNKLNSIEEYLTLNPSPPDAEKHSRIQNFIKLYNDLKYISVAVETEKTYAESFYFNDTLVTLHSRNELIEYLKNTQKNLKSIDFSVLNIIEQDEDVFVQWKMTTGFEILGSNSHVESIGISHLRFDTSGKIVMHQDYWDSTNGFFQHIPVIGGILEWIKKRLH